MSSYTIKIKPKIANYTIVLIIPNPIAEKIHSERKYLKIKKFIMVGIIKTVAIFIISQASSPKIAAGIERFIELLFNISLYSLFIFVPPYST